MFFNATLKSDLFYVHKAAQCLMVILIVAMVFTPLFYPQQEAEAAWVMVTVVIIGTTFTIYVWLDGICDQCGDGRKTDHRQNCDNCNTLDYFCPMFQDYWYPHPHQNRCVHCYGVWWNCDGKYNGWNAWIAYKTKHDLARCPCGETYRICTEAHEHVHGSGSSDNCSSGCGALG